MKKVLILYKFLPQYRIQFFEKLRDELFLNNIELILIYGKLKNIDSKKNDERDIEWAIYRDNRVFHIGKFELIWQPCLDLLPKIDLVIVEQANRLMVNYLLMVLSKIMKFKFAFWGHGANMQIEPKNIKNRFKYFFLNQSDYWFAYTNGVKNLLVSKGVTNNKITVVNNAIDTKILKDYFKEISMDKVAKLKEEMGIRSDNIGIYCGGIYKEKRIQFLLNASKIIKEKIKDFTLIILGAGPESYEVEKVAEMNDWIHYLGPKFGLEKVIYFKMSDLFLLPGAVGLAILDSFAMQTPMFTTKYPFHGPEIEYLEHGKNGIITKNNIEDFSKQVIDAFENKKEIELLKKACLKSSGLYSNEDMVENFKNGVVACLEK